MHDTQTCTHTGTHLLVSRSTAGGVRLETAVTAGNDCQLLSVLIVPLSENLLTGLAALQVEEIPGFMVMFLCAFPTGCRQS